MSLAVNLDADNLWWIYPAVAACFGAGVGIGWLINWAFRGRT